MTHAVVLPEKRRVLLAGHTWPRISAVIPTAKKIYYKEKPLVAVPYCLDAARVLNNLGYEVPSPIEFYYDWPGRYKPFHAQLETAKFLSLTPRGFVLNELGTGKTLAALWAFDYLRSLGMVQKVLVVSPLSTLERVWGDEIFEHFVDLDFVVLHGTPIKRRKLLQQPADVFIINHEGVAVLADELVERRDIDLVIVDELAVYRNQSTKMWKALNKVIAKKPRVWGLTGTPIPNEPVDAYAQIKLVNPSRVPRYFGAFRDQVMRKVSMWKWVARPGAIEAVYDAMQPAVRFTRAECLDLPPVMVETRHVELTQEQQEAYEQMRLKLVAEYRGDKIAAVNEAVKAMKLVQIACGVVYNNYGEEVTIAADHRLEATREIIEAAPSKVIVFVPFVSALAAVQEYMNKHFPTAMIHGGVSKAERDVIFSKFQDSDELRVLVAQPGTMAHGLTLTAASTIVWFAPITSAETYQQACGRISRAGQTLSQLIIHIEATGLERSMYNRLKNKERMQGVLLDMMQAATA